MRAPPDAETIISGVLRISGALHRPRDHLAHHRAHAAADERILHHARDHRPPQQLALRVDDRIFQPGVVLRLPQPRRVRLQVHKLQRIGRRQIPVEGLILVVIAAASASRVRASMRKCLSHFGHTFKFSSRSFFQMICRQFSHFTHKPSVRTVFLPEVSKLSGFAFKPSHSQLPVPSTQYRVEARFSVLGTRYSLLDSPLRHHASPAHTSHLAHSVTVSTASTIVGCAFLPVKMTCTISGFLFRLSTTLADRAFNSLPHDEVVAEGLYGA